MNEDESELLFENIKVFKDNIDRQSTALKDLDQRTFQLSLEAYKIAQTLDINKTDGLKRFKDLEFKPHYDGIDGHLHARMTFANGREISVTKGGRNLGDKDKPYEVQDDEGQIHGYQTASGVSVIMGAIQIKPTVIEEAKEEIEKIEQNDKPKF